MGEPARGCVTADSRFGGSINVPEPGQDASSEEAHTMRTLTFGERLIGNGYPTYVVAEIGINHNGSLDIAKRLIDTAVKAKCDAVKFQKRTPELCVPLKQRDQLRDTPWGVMTYLEYRRRMEFGLEEYGLLIEHC